METFQYRKQYGPVATYYGYHHHRHDSWVSIPQAVWLSCNIIASGAVSTRKPVSIPQAVWLSCNRGRYRAEKNGYRVSIPQAVWLSCNVVLLMYLWLSDKSFNTASGMAQLQLWKPPLKTFFLLQCFNTASGIALLQHVTAGSYDGDSQFQYRKRYGSVATWQDLGISADVPVVSIPQAVWPWCN